MGWRRPSVLTRAEVRADRAGPDVHGGRRDVIENRGGKWVVLSEAGEVLGEHDTQEAATEQLRAIEASKSRERTGDGPPAPSTRTSGARGDRVQRWAPVELHLDASTVVHHENGWMDVSGVATRSGVFLYAEGDGTEKRELRPRSEVFDAESLASLVGVPFTNDHPAAPLDSENTQLHQVGHVLQVIPRIDAGIVEVRLRITHKTTLDEILAGKLELSGGYTTDVIEEPGVEDGERYDAVQTRIRYNHLALVDEARAGPIARLRLDGAKQVKTIKITLKGKTHTVHSDKLNAVLSAATPFRVDQIEAVPITIGTAKLMLPAQMVANIEALITGEPPAAPAAGDGALGDAGHEGDVLGEDPDEEELLDEGEPGMPVAGTAAPKPSAGAPASRGDARGVAKVILDRLTALETKIDGVGGQVETRIRSRAALERQAAPILGANYRFNVAAATDGQVMADAILALNDGLKATVEAHRKDTGFLRGMFAMAVERHAKEGDHSTGLRTALVGARKDGVVSKIDAAEQRYHDRLAGKKPKPNALDADSSGIPN